MSLCCWLLNELHNGVDHDGVGARRTRFAEFTFIAILGGTRMCDTEPIDIFSGSGWILTLWMLKAEVKGGLTSMPTRSFHALQQCTLRPHPCLFIPVGISIE
jgi:hypothetical protein